MISIDFRKIKTVWVDLDDTLWDFRENSWDSLGTVYEIHNLNRFFSDVDSWRERYLYHNHRLWAQYNVGEISVEFLQRERFIRPLTEGGATLEEAERLTPVLHHDYLDVLGKHSKLIDGARDLLETLKHYGFVTGIISNGFKEVQFKKLESSKIENLIDVIVLSDDVGVNKPNRQIFDYALKQAGTSVEESLIIGDNPSTDIAGGAAAGWKTIFFNRDGAMPHCPEADAEVTSLKEITDRINQQLRD